MTWTIQPRSEGAGGLAYWRAGSGPVLILVHGVGLRAEAWAGVVPTLSGHFDIHCVDIPGHGVSALRNEQSLDNYVDRFEAFASGFGGPIFVAGHSMGAMITLELAARMPEHVAGIAALNAIYRRSPEAAKAVQQRAAALRSDEVTSPDGTLTRWFGDAPEGALATARVTCKDWLTNADPVGYATAYSVFAHHDGPSDALLKNLTCPALFQTGEADANSTPEMSHRMSGLTSQGHAQTVPGAAHMMPMTHADVVAGALLKTFQPHPSKG